MQQDTTHQDRRTAPRQRNPAQRENVFAALVAAGEPLDAREVAAAVGIHVSTARFHLNKLAQAGRLTSRLLRPGRAGRPRLEYSAVVGPPVGELIGLLLDRLAGTPEIREHLAADAGRVWAARHARSYDHADLPDPVTVATDMLQRLGFRISATVSAFGTHELRICSCPLREVAREHPEIAHGVVRGLIEQSLAGSSPALAAQYAVRALPDPADGACEITLRLAPLGS